MAKAKKTQPKKPRAAKYDEKLPIKGRFDDALKDIKKNKEDKQKSLTNDIEDFPEDDRELGGEG